MAQKILSCVVRLRESFEASHTAKVLAGSDDEQVLQRSHNELTTYGLLADTSQRQIRDWIEQLIGQNCLEREEEFRQLKVTSLGWQVIRGEKTPMLLQTAKKPRRTSPAEQESWGEVDEVLFDWLRNTRRRIAKERKVPGHIIAPDVSLRDMARKKPSTTQELLEIEGMGVKKVDKYGKLFLETIAEYTSQ